MKPGRKPALTITRAEFVDLLNQHCGDLAKLWKKLKFTKVTGHKYIKEFGIVRTSKYE